VRYSQVIGGESFHPIPNALHAMTNSVFELISNTADLQQARELYSQDFYFQLEHSKGGREALLAVTSGKPRGRVEFLISSFIEMALEGSPAATLLCRAHQFLLDKEAVLDALEAAPWGEGD
jgi:hypothetical protein